MRLRYKEARSLCTFSASLVVVSELTSPSLHYKSRHKPGSFARITEYFALKFYHSIHEILEQNIGGCILTQITIQRFSRFTFPYRSPLIYSNALPTTSKHSIFVILSETDKKNGISIVFFGDFLKPRRTVEHLVNKRYNRMRYSSSSSSVFIQRCPLSRDGQIYPIPSAIARTPSLHIA